MAPALCLGSAMAPQAARATLCRVSYRSGMTEASWQEDDDEDDFVFTLSGETATRFKEVSDRMGHDGDYNRTMRAALVLYDLIAEWNMGPGRVEIGVLQIPGSDKPSERYPLDFN